ncbi:ComF family protein [Candidatus Uhrbacteria bacterium]|nr:ComF family protein [Candidatus Uhrbacteria bacterium]
MPLLWDLLFPVRCVSCRAPGSWWCEVCRKKSELIRRNPCPNCASRKAVHDCPKSLGLDGIAALGFYHDPRLRSVLHALKYKGATVVMSAVEERLGEWAEERLDIWPWSGLSNLAIQPAIGAPHSVRRRGFDQAHLLSCVVNRVLIPWAAPLDILTRTDSLEPQARLDVGDVRRANVAGSFGLEPGASVPPNILLVDDVLTSGATLDEAARVLRAAGAEKIYALVLAIGA